MLNEEVRRNEKAEIELAILNAVKAHDGYFHKRTLSKDIGYAEGTVLKYLTSLIDREIVKQRPDGRNLKLFITDKTDGVIAELKTNLGVKDNDRP